MSNYKGIKGFQVQTRTEDPVPYAQALADNPYAGSWSSGGSMNTGRQSPYSNGTQSAAWCAGGYSTAKTALNEHYNGTSWTETHDTNRAVSAAGGFGTSTLAVLVNGYMGGNPSPTYYPTQAEEYDGSSWTSGGSLVTGRTSVTTCAFGTQTAAGQCGANQPSNPSPGKINFLLFFSLFDILTDKT